MHLLFDFILTLFCFFLKLYFSFDIILLCFKPCCMHWISYFIVILVISEKNKFAKLAGKEVSTLRSARCLRLLPLSMYSQMKKQRRLLHQPVALQA